MVEVGVFFPPYQFIGDGFPMDGSLCGYFRTIKLFLVPTHDTRQNKATVGTVRSGQSGGPTVPEERRPIRRRWLAPSRSSSVRTASRGKKKKKKHKSQDGTERVRAEKQASERASERERESGDLPGYQWAPCRTWWRDQARSSWSGFQNANRESNE